MARLPQPGSDQGTWGAILNDFLVQAHNNDGTLKVESVTSPTITNGAVTEVKLDAATQAKLNAVASGGVASVNGRGGSVVLTKTDVDLANVDNTSDANKPVSTATQTALNLKANTSSLATVATSGSYADLTNKPDIGAKVLVLNQGDAVPGGTAVGTVILRRQ